VLNIVRAVDFAKLESTNQFVRQENVCLHRQRLVMKPKMAMHNIGSAHFSDEKFAEMLRATNNSQESITRVSKWMRHNKKYSPKIVNVWLKVGRQCLNEWNCCTFVSIAGAAQREKQFEVDDIAVRCERRDSKLAQRVAVVYGELWRGERFAQSWMKLCSRSNVPSHTLQNTPTNGRYTRLNEC
jgi:hypothetical protein